tara:strand:- start:842 stop:967 length:126 start_codon:yes stop_codon:yes gene_type:complete
MKKIKKFLGVTYPKGWVWLGLITIALGWGWCLGSLIKYLLW